MTDGTPAPQYGFGWRPSLPDPRDVQADPTEIPVRREVDPRGEYMTPVYDQGSLGSCTSNAVAAAIDALRIVDGQEPFLPSRLAIYWLERWLEHQPATADSGAYGRDGFKAARRYGVVPEKDWEYVDSDTDPRFSADPRESASWAPDHWLLDRPYKAVRRSLLDFKRILSNRQTIAFGFRVPNGFMSEQMRKTGVMEQPDPEDLTNEGHEVLAVGYLKDEPHYALVRNSWGTDWGIGGFFLMPWTWLLDANLTSDLRTLYRPLGQR
jgi:C1A family cysteine protease